jgi:SecD/SecF fusion protein
MNAKNLPLKFAFVALLVAFCLYALYAGGLQYGIDLQGGHSLIFEIRTPKAELDALKVDLARQKELLPKAVTEEQKQAIQGKIKRIEGEIAGHKESAGDEQNLAERMIEILKDRIDPQGLANLEWRPVGSNRIEVRMPAARQETSQRQEVYDRAIRALAASNITRAEKRNYLDGTAEQREKILARFSKPHKEAFDRAISAMAKSNVTLAEIRDYLDGTKEQRQKILARFTEPQKKAVVATGEAYDSMAQANALVAVGDAYDKLAEANKALDAARASGNEQTITAAQAALDTARANHREKELAEAGTDIRIAQVEGILKNYRTTDEEQGLGTKEKTDLRDQFTQDVETLKGAHTGRRELIDKVVEAYKSWSDVRHRLSDPADLERRIARAGVLEFRIVAGEHGERVTPQQSEEYVDLLKKDGPDEARRRGLPFTWFPVRSTDRKSYGGMIMADYAGKSYVLLSNLEGYKMTREVAAGGWTLTGARRGADQMGRAAIDFSFDEKGAKHFYNLTSTNQGKRMAILLDDEVFSAPTIQAAISSNGQITGRFSAKEIDENIKLLQAGSLPARLNPTPVAVSSFGPTLGKENRDAGIRAAYLGLICVAVFMLIYYMLGGLIANVALMLNIILVLGAMSLLSAVFTLPGIAGVILTIGMAVDANVLIFERLREEQAKGQSVRMAMKNAYERAFSAIFDSNITTLLTCLILGWVGTIEVRGFAITLGLGVLFSLFTALSVTRWIFQALLDAGWLKNPVKMLSIIGVPNVNWMSNRVYFWGFSGIFIVLGLSAMYVQGGKMLGIEFSSGTQAVIQFKTDALIGRDGQVPNDDLVRRLFTEQAAGQGYKGLGDARVEMLIDNDKVGRFLSEYDKNKDSKVSPEELKAGGLDERWVKLMDTNKDDTLEPDELAKLPALSYQVSTTETRLKLIQEVASNAFRENLRQRTKCAFEPADKEKDPDLGLTTDALGIARVVPDALSPYSSLLENYDGGVAVVVKNVTPPISEADLKQRISDTRAQQGSGTDVARISEVIGLGSHSDNRFSRFAVLVMLDEVAPSLWPAAADQQRQIVVDALQREEAIVATSFDPAVAGLASQRALIAIILSWVAIVLYLWLRFGSIKWGLAAVACLVHDTIIVTGLVAASAWVYESAFGRALGIEWFKIDLAMVAAILTVIGYSVNDTIVVFDRIRENRGKLTTVSEAVINRSINQTLSRTLLTSGTTLIVVFIMYVWGGQGIKGFNFALLAGILFGTYSSVAIAAPLLMGFRKAVFGRAFELSPEA